MEIRNHIYHFSVDPKATGERIRDLRKAKGLTADKLAEKLYRSPKTISSWETGTRFPSIDNLVDLANLFEVSVHSLMLPNDNCEVECLETIKLTGSGNYLSDKYSIATAKDEVFSYMLLREEYLFQRLLSGVITKANLYEYETVFVESLEAPITDVSICNTAENYFYLLKNEKRNKLFHILFNRLWHNENLYLTLTALNRFEKDLLFTTCIYFGDLRTQTCAEILYNIGARFINCNFVKNKEIIEIGMCDTPEKEIFNHGYYTINSEDDIANWLDMPKEDIDFEWLEIPRYSEDPSYYNGHVNGKINNDEKDPNTRKKLSAYYFMLDFIRETITSHENYISNVIEHDNMSYDVYINSLLEGGLLSK